jgi:hypothetical protein
MTSAQGMTLPNFNEPQSSTANDKALSRFWLPVVIRKMSRR